MEDGSQARLDQLFPRLDVLAAPVRLQLSGLLATPTSVPAVLALEIAGLPLPSPSAHDLRRALRAVIEKGLGPEALAALRPLRLSDVVPPISICEGGPAATGCPVRLRELLRRQGPTTWAELGALTLAEMATWTNVGPSTLAGLVGAAVEAASGPGSAGAPDGPVPAPEPEPAALARLLRHEKAGGGGGGAALRRALEAHAEGDGPAKVRAAAASLLAAADRAADPHLAPLDRVWEAAGDHRDRGVLFHRALRLERRLSAKELAQALGLSDNRVFQIQTRAEQRARACAGGEKALETLAVDLRGLLGSVCRLAAVDDALAALGLPARVDPRAALLVWLAGPYLPVAGQAGWVAKDPATVLADTRRLLHEDGGVRRLDQVAADLEAAGIAAHDVGDWLAWQPAVVVDGLAVPVSGTTADVAERLLSATGRAMTAAELASAAGNPNPEAAATLDGRLRGDGRFLRVDRDHFEPAEWGGEAFTEPPPPAPAELFPGAGRGRAPAGRSQLRIEVDAAVLRGTGEPVPLAVVEALGVPCGGRRTFTTRFGPVALSRAAAQASRGSIRPVALAVGARAGDALVLEFDATTGGASVELVPAPSSAAG